jgi:hypothetical protein
MGPGLAWAIQWGPVLKNSAIHCYVWQYFILLCICSLSWLQYKLSDNSFAWLVLSFLISSTFILIYLLLSCSFPEISECEAQAKCMTVCGWGTAL